LKKLTPLKKLMYIHKLYEAGVPISNMQLNCDYLKIEQYQINYYVAVAALYSSVQLTSKQISMHLVDESRTARCAVVRWRQHTT